MSIDYERLLQDIQGNKNEGMNIIMPQKTFYYIQKEEGGKTYFYSSSNEEKTKKEHIFNRKYLDFQDKMAPLLCSEELEKISELQKVVFSIPRFKLEESPEWQEYQELEKKVKDRLAETDAYKQLQKEKEQVNSLPDFSWHKKTEDNIEDDEGEADFMSTFHKFNQVYSIYKGLKKDNEDLTIDIMRIKRDQNITSVIHERVDPDDFETILKQEEREDHPEHHTTIEGQLESHRTASKGTKQIRRK